MRKLILRNNQSPGDIVMLTAAVRDLHRAAPGQFLTDVRTKCPGLWEHNPWLTPLREDEPGVEVIDCQYPLIHQSNQRPVHFLHGFAEHLGERLGVRIVPTEFKGDIHLSADERRWRSQVHDVTGEARPFWIIVAGGKWDYTAKWWPHDRWQQVVDYFGESIFFVQVGERHHYHPPLRGVLDLRGKTSLRQFVRLVYHADGVLCPVTLAMHLAAAVPMPPRRGASRPCVVVAGGREPPHWEAYPTHRYLHTVGVLPCCDPGGCWKSRVVRLGDGDQKDESLCVDVVEMLTGKRRRGEEWGGCGRGELPDFLPRCLQMVSVGEVIRAMKFYARGRGPRRARQALPLAA